MRTPPPGFGAARERIDAGASVLTRHLFYLSSVAYASDLVVKETKARSVVCDRYIVSTLACHRALGLKSTWDVAELGLVNPDYTFFLQVSDEDVRQRRLNSRCRITASDKLVDDAALRARMIKEYDQFPCIKVDTTGSTVDEVVEAICRHLETDGGLLGKRPLDSETPSRFHRGDVFPS